MLIDSILMNMKGSLIMVVIFLMIINVMDFVGGPEDHPQAQWFVRRIQRTQYNGLDLLQWKDS